MCDACAEESGELEARPQAAAEANAALRRELKKAEAVTAAQEAAEGAMPRRLRVPERGRGGRRAAPRASSHPPCRGEGVPR